MDLLSNPESGLQGPNRADLQGSLQNELERLLQEQRKQQIFGRDVHRSGSAPPTVEGFLDTMGSQFMNPNFAEINSSISSNGDEFLSEEELRYHPAYLSYYYSNHHINPRLPPPLLSKEDWLVAQRFQSSSSSLDGLVEWRNKLVPSDDSSSLFSVQPGIAIERAENDLLILRNAAVQSRSGKMSAEWLQRGSEGLVGSSSTGLGPRRKSFADILQEGLDQNATLSSQMSRPASCNMFRDVSETSVASDLGSARLCHGLETPKTLPSGVICSLPGVQSRTTAVPHSLASTLGSSLPRSKTPESQQPGRFVVSGLPPVGGKVSSIEKKKNPIGSNMRSIPADSANFTNALSGLTLSETRLEEDTAQLQDELEKQSEFMFKIPNGHKQSLQQQELEQISPISYSGLGRKSGMLPSHSDSVMASHGQINIPRKTSSSSNLYSVIDSSGVGSLCVPNVSNSNASVNGTVLSGCFANSVNHKLNSITKHGLTEAVAPNQDRQTMSGLVNQAAPDFHSPLADPRNLQYLQRNLEVASSVAASPSDLLVNRNLMGVSHGDLGGIQKEYLSALLAQQKQQYDLSLLANSGCLGHRYYGNHPYDLGIMYPGNPVAYPSFGSRNIQNERTSRYSPMMRSPMGGSLGSYRSEISNTGEVRYMPSLLDEFKSNKTRLLELSDIVRHVIEFSTDQYGSRFIQQKLETATEEEKNQIFPEIIPYARALMTDVFGNYVIQKFFEHGTENQRKVLANQLTGCVLPLSLQMYGCRVIQKALEVVDLDQQTQMVTELDVAVMKCIRDQNGNHVIQKCIECVPQDRIQFIVSSFYGQVASLSTHPYGCRVIQRVLEHCDDANTQQIVMDEIMKSVCTLAQDQYGNYVIQHVLEHGKPHERSEIIRKLAGQIVKMSQQKFASNVVEKCLMFGGPEERQLLVDEMLGSTDENEPLQAMMKDPFGNYVVQKVLETCDDQSLELILSRIKVHLNALKKYTYGKHIVSRVEKLITAGERRIGLSSAASLSKPSE